MCCRSATLTRIMRAHRFAAGRCDQYDTERHLLYDAALVPMIICSTQYLNSWAAFKLGHFAR